MLIGSDVSIQECRASGYVVLDVPKSWVPTDKGTMRLQEVLIDKDKNIHVTVGIPEMWPYGKNIPGAKREELYAVDTWPCFDDLVERFNDSGDGIKSYCDWENCPIELEKPTVYDMVHLASVVSGYCGIE